MVVIDIFSKGYKRPVIVRFILQTQTIFFIYVFNHNHLQANRKLHFPDIIVRNDKIAEAENQRGLYSCGGEKVAS